MYGLEHQYQLITMRVTSIHVYSGILLRARPWNTLIRTPNSALRFRSLIAFLSQLNKCSFSVFNLLRKTVNNIWNSESLLPGMISDWNSEIVPGSAAIVIVPGSAATVIRLFACFHWPNFYAHELILTTPTLEKPYPRMGFVARNVMCNNLLLGEACKATVWWVSPPMIVGSYMAMIRYCLAKLAIME